MAWIQFDASFGQQIEKRYRFWGASQPRQPGQIGSAMLSSVEAGPDPDNIVDMQLPDAFVDELEGSGIPFKRR